MKIPALLSVVALFGHASAFSGQLNANTPIIDGHGNLLQTVYVTDYKSGALYYAPLTGGWDACTTTECEVGFFEDPDDGGYNFPAMLWRTSDGCHNIDFLGALDAHHGYCYGSLPCDITA